MSNTKITATSDEVATVTPSDCTIHGGIVDPKRQHANSNREKGVGVNHFLAFNNQLGEVSLSPGAIPTIKPPHPRRFA